MNQSGSSMRPRFLVAPLDWGLGHATRCIPLISVLLHQGASVVLAGEGPTRHLLEQEFPSLPFVHLPGYGIRYARAGGLFPLRMALQIPKILSAIQYENERLKELVKEQAIDAVISDNRYGLFHRKIPTVFLTHQLLIKTGLGSQADAVLRKINYSYINQFSECWVPDHEHEPSLAGSLSHPFREPAIPLRYLGPLSRFSEEVKDHSETHLLILLSGPEPQRTILEKRLLEQLQNYSGPVVLVRGLPGHADKLQDSPYLTVHNHLPAAALKEKILGARYVVARCGYSTIMDLAALGKKSILIPTPGQTEQEYLSKYITGNKLALCIRQDKFRLKAALDLAGRFPYRLGVLRGNHLEDAVKSLLYKIRFKAFPN